MIKINIVKVKNAWEWGWPWEWDEVLDSVEFPHCYTIYDTPVTKWVKTKLTEYNEKYDLVDFEYRSYELDPLNLVYYDNPYHEILRIPLVEAYYNQI